MTKRRTAYSVEDVSSLRAVVKNKYLWGRYDGFNLSGNSRCYLESDMNSSVEEIVRTHMIAGHTAQDLLDSEASK